MTDLTSLEARDFDLYLSQSEKAARTEAVSANDAFAAAMNRAIKRGREKVTAGTFVDRSAPIGALRIRGEVAMSACGSPAAMCIEGARAGGATEAMK